MQNFPPKSFMPDSIESAQIPIDLKAALLDLRFEADKPSKAACWLASTGQNYLRTKRLRTPCVHFPRHRGIDPDARIKIKEIQLTSALETHAAKASNRNAAQTIAIAATFTAEPIEESLRYWTKELDFPRTSSCALQPGFSAATGSVQFIVAKPLWPQCFAGASRRLANAGTAAGHLDGCDNVQRSANELAMASNLQPAAGPFPAWFVFVLPRTKIIPDSPESQSFGGSRRIPERRIGRCQRCLLAGLGELWNWYLWPSITMRAETN